MTFRACSRLLLGWVLMLRVNWISTLQMLWFWMITCTRYWRWFVCWRREISLSISISFGHFHTTLLSCRLWRECFTSGISGCLQYGRVLPWVWVALLWWVFRICWVSLSMTKAWNPKSKIKESNSTQRKLAFPVLPMESSRKIKNQLPTLSSFKADLFHLFIWIQIFI